MYQVWGRGVQYNLYRPHLTSMVGRALALFLRAVMQKVLFRRGKGRTLLSKSHLIEFVDILSDNIPEAKFVDIVRHPKDSLVSWLALQQAGSRVFVRHQFPLQEAVAAHLR